MLTIRREQIEIFQREMDKRFLDETVTLLRKEHTEQVTGLAENVLRERVSNGLRRARKYGIELNVLLQIFVELMFDFGPHFDEHPVVAALLHDLSRPVEDNLDAFIFEGSDRVWEELAILSEGDGWDDLCAREAGSEF